MTRLDIVTAAIVSLCILAFAFLIHKTHRLFQPKEMPELNEVYTEGRHTKIRGAGWDVTTFSLPNETDEDAKARAIAVSERLDEVRQELRNEIKERFPESYWMLWISYHNTYYEASIEFASYDVAPSMEFKGLRHENLDSIAATIRAIPFDRWLKK